MYLTFFLILLYISKFGVRNFRVENPSQEAMMKLLFELVTQEL